MLDFFDINDFFKNDEDCNGDCNNCDKCNDAEFDEENEDIEEEDKPIIPCIFVKLSAPLYKSKLHLRKTCVVTLN